MTWSIRYTRAADRQIKALDPPVRARVLAAVGRLATNPHNATNVESMRGSDRYRLRVGDWRVIYTLDDDVLLVLVIRVAHRREAYR